MAAPLAERMRPKTLESYTGQEHLVGEGEVLRKAIESGLLPSIILWGPPGVGKTTLAKVISEVMSRPFYTLSAINSGVKDIRDTIALAKKQAFFDAPNPILFIDEIHRFSKSQQDALLGAVEDGTITLIGATTENPSFEVNRALLSRCQVYILKSLDLSHLKSMIDRAIVEDYILKKRKITIESYTNLIRYSSGDGRKLYNTLELVVNQFMPGEDVVITDDIVYQVIRQNIAQYDKGGDQAYDHISALIKSIRGSDADASVYYLAKMLKAGEDPLYICRRLVISAAEDIGLANPNALLLANACFDTVHKIGAQEGRIVMSQTVIYLAMSPKSNSAYVAINKAMQYIDKHPNLSVPLHLRNAPTKLMKDIGYGSGYQYAHEQEVTHDHLPDEAIGEIFYLPSENSSEQRLVKEKLDRKNKRKQ